MTIKKNFYSMNKTMAMAGLEQIYKLWKIGQLGFETRR
jgi:hypothetical protein